jgi:3-oxoacyl-[acyl-carrier protein] reductase
MTAPTHAPSARRFEGASVLVTGASRGLGASMAVAFASEGAAVVWLGYRARQSEAEATAARVEQAGARAELLCFDVRSPEAVAQAFERVAAAKQADRGTLDVLVNNAGISRDAHFPLLDEEAWHDVIETNLGGTARCCRAAVRAMWRARHGVIVNVASIAGPMASPGQASYAASKGGIVALTRTLAAELAPRGIRVNAVVPGLIDAGMTMHLDRRVLEPKLAEIALGRLGQADEVARAVLFLASEDASYVVGQALVVDGGLSL